MAPISSPEIFWNEEKERELISLFSKHSCLWNQKCESYRNRELRSETLEHLRIHLSAHPPPVPYTVEDIRTKFKNLRTTFQRQYKMVKASEACGSDDPFVSQWKHYDQLMFLQACWEQDEGAEEPSLVIVKMEETQSDVSSPDPLLDSFLPEAPLSGPSALSSCVAVNAVPKCYWTAEKERALISFYGENRSLWSMKSENHNNRQLRQQLLETLRDRLSDEAVTFSVEDIKGKFKNLRTVFKREFKGMQVSRTCDKPYVSKWKHFQHLLFLRELCDEDDGTDDLPAVVLQENCCSSPTATTKADNCQSTRIDTSYQIPLPAYFDNFKAALQPASSSPPTSYDSVSVESDVRENADSRCHWSEAKVRELISFHSEHSCLWNHKCESYENRLLRRSLLETLSRRLSENESVPFTVEDIKAKFRNLRTIFQQEHNVVNSNKTCGSGDFYLSKWKHYRDLMFLRDSCDEDHRLFHRPQDAQHLLPETQTRYSFNAPPSPTPPDSQRTSRSSSPSQSTSSSHAGGRALGRKRGSGPAPPPVTAEILDFMRMFYQSQTLSPHAGFLKYVEECLNETPPHKVKKLKKTIIDAIHSMPEED